MTKEHSKLLHDLVSSNPDIESIFFRLKIIMSELPNTDKTNKIRQWIHNEVTGYVDISSIPEYRFMQTRPVGTYINNNYAKIINTVVPLRLSEMPLEEIKSWEKLEVNNPIKAIQAMIESNRPVSIAIPAEILYKYSRNDFQMIAVKMEIAANQLSTIETTVKSKLIEIIIELEKELPNIDSLDIPKKISEDQEKMKGLTNTIINIITDESIKIGDSNEINKSKVGQFRKK